MHSSRLGGRGSGKAVLVKALEEYAGLGKLLLMTSHLDDEKAARDKEAQRQEAMNAARQSTAAAAQSTDFP